MTEDAKTVEECLKKLDWKGLAEAFQKGDIEWHAQEWQDFIKSVEQKAILAERERIRKEVENIIKKIKPGDSRTVLLTALHEVTALLEGE